MASSIRLVINAFLIALIAAGFIQTGWAADQHANTGETLKARYADMLSRLQAEIRKDLPNIDAGKMAALNQSRSARQAASTERDNAQKNLDAVSAAKGLVDHAKGKWIAGAEKGIVQAQAAIKNAKTDAARSVAHADLAKCQKDKENGQKALESRQSAYEKLKLDEPKLRQQLKTADEALTKANADEASALRAVMADVSKYLSSDQRDATIVKAVVLTVATPAELAKFAQESKSRESLVDQLLADVPLMKEMLSAGGPAKGKYAQAMQILADIRKASPRSHDGHFRRLAVAVSLAHAEPIPQRNTEDEKQTDQFVAPVARYLHYEKAFLAGELDLAFASLTTWEYRYVVDSYASDAMLTWAREMLRNYRPDHIFNPDYGWRYSGAVRTDVAYRHSNEYQDDPSLNFFQNICKNGGICGRRAFFGRYVVQAFGLPARPFTQPKHAAIVRWTPSGWVVNLGAAWPVGWFPEQRGPEFLAESQAREFPNEYVRVLRAEWIDALQPKAPAAKNKVPAAGIWKQIADHEQSLIVAASKKKNHGPLGADIAEATESRETRAAAVAAAVITDADRKITTAANGEITIPAAAIAGGNHLVKSFRGGQQAIAAKPMTVTLDSPKPGKYHLIADVVTVHGDDQIAVTTGTTTTNLVIPFTIGQWQKTVPTEVTLTAGKNIIKLSQPKHAFAIKGFTLRPVK
jgi:hypothetical protein